jgi:hypothetical protein
MRPDKLKAEAAECRRQAATDYLGKPEEAFLLQLATMFEDLAEGRAPGGSARG